MDETVKTTQAPVPWKLIAFVFIFAFLFLAGFNIWFFKDRVYTFSEPSVTVTSAPAVTTSPSESPPSEPVSVTPALTDHFFSDFSDLQNEVAPVLEKGEFATLANMQNPIEVSCSRREMAMPSVCEEAGEGQKVWGWLIGIEASEGNTYAKEKYIQTLTTYHEQNGPFANAVISSSEDTGTITLLNPNKTKKLALVLKRTSMGKWIIDYTLIGLNLEK